MFFLAVCKKNQLWIVNVNTLKKVPTLHISIYYLNSIVVEADISSCSRRVLSNHDQNLAIGKKSVVRST